MRRHHWLLLLLLLGGAAWVALSTRDGRGQPVREEGAVGAASAEVTLETQPALRSNPGAVDATPARSREEAQATASGPLGPTTRGRLVDARTREPVFGVWVSTGKGYARTDANGAFDTGDPLDELAKVVVLNLASIPRELWSRTARGWEIPLAIGPTFRIHFKGLEGTVLQGAWMGRLVHGTAEAWKPVFPGAPPFLRYEQPLDDPVPGEAGEMWLELRSSDGLQEGRAKVAALRGVQDVEVDLRSRAVVRGRVVDESGAPRAGVAFLALQFSEKTVERSDGVTQSDGSYQIHASKPGRMRIAFERPGAPLRTELLAPLGVTQAPDVVLARSPVAGSVEGSLRFLSGSRSARGKARLQALDGSGYEQVTRFGLFYFEDEEAAGRAPPDRSVARFRFDQLPPGRYRVSVSTEEGFPCSPSSIEVDAPGDGLVFTAEDSALVSYSFDVRDAETCAALRSAHVWLKGPGLDGVDVELWMDASEIVDGYG